MLVLQILVVGPGLGLTAEIERPEFIRRPQIRAPKSASCFVQGLAGNSVDHPAFVLTLVLLERIQG